MKRSLVTILAVVSLAACFDDPTSGGRNGPSRLRLSNSRLFVEPGDSVIVSGTVLDEQGNPVPGTVTFVSVDPAVATAGDLPETVIPGALESSGFVKGLVAGATYIRVTHGGLTDSLYVVVVPPSFTGVVTPANPSVTDTVTITTGGALVFIPANVEVLMGGVNMQVVSATATTVRFLPVFTADGEVLVGGLQLAGSIDLPPIPATTTVNVADLEPDNEDPGAGLVIAGTVAIGDTVYSAGAVTGPTTAGVGGDDINDYFTFTPAVSMGVRVEMEWLDEDVDIDGFVLNSAGGGFCVLDGCSGATAANPELMTVALTGGTSYQIYVNLWDTHGAPTPLRYIVRIIRTS